MRRHDGPAKRARCRGTMCPSLHQDETDQGCTLRPSPDPTSVQKRLRIFSPQFHDLRPVRAHIATADDGRFASWCGSCAKARRSLGKARTRKFVMRVQIMLKSAAIE